MRSTIPHDWRPLLFALGGLLVIAGLATGSRAAAAPRTFQTVPTATPRTTLPPPTDTPLPGQTPPPSPTGPAPTPLPTGTGRAIGALEVRKEAAHSDVLAGDEAVFRVWLSNTGEAAITGILLTDDLDPALEPLQISATQGFTEVNGQSLVIHVGTLEPGQAAMAVIRTRVRAGVDNGQIILNQARAYHDSGQALSGMVAIGLPPDGLPETGQDGRQR